MPQGSSGRGIPAPAIQPNVQHLKFSFRHIDLENDTFSLNQCTDAFMRQLLIRIKEFSAWTVDRFTDQNNNEHRHIIYFPDTTQPNGFTNIDAEQLAYHESWQFQLCPDRFWRVHGILIDDMFYIVWLDPQHSLYGKDWRS